MPKIALNHFAVQQLEMKINWSRESTTADNPTQSHGRVPLFAHTSSRITQKITIGIPLGARSLSDMISNGFHQSCKLYMYYPWYY